jgi:nitrite reductase/ring-hydroxylating ferredoxin subunit
MAYVRNAWYVAGWSPDLPQDRPSAVSLLGEPLVLWHSGAAWHAFEDRCVHRLAPLSLGRCESGHLRCLYHGLRFAPDGRVVEIPGQDRIPPQARVRRYPVADRHSWLWVWMGDPELADESLIPPAVGFDNPAWILGRGHLDYAAEARLINDNLLDFSHLSFVHADSFGASAAWAEEHPRITPLPRGIRYERWVESSAPMRGREHAGRVDGWTRYDFLVPGVLLMLSAQYPEGTARACQQAEPPADLPAIGKTFTSQAVTPTTERTSRYFFSWGPHRTCGDEALRDVLMGIAGQAFGEDKVMIEAQQRVIDRTPAPRIMPTAHDRAVTLFNQLVARLVREETGRSIEEPG